VSLTALGGWLAEHAGFDVAWALDLALSLTGLRLAWVMTDLPATPDEPDDEEGNAAHAPFAGLGLRLPWPLLVPATLVVTLASVIELLAQTTRREGADAWIVALVIVARGLIPIRARMLDATGVAALAGLALIALVPGAVLPGAARIFLAGGVAPASRSALVQRGARDGERATVGARAPDGHRDHGDRRPLPRSARRSHVPLTTSAQARRASVGAEAARRAPTSVAAYEVILGAAGSDGGDEGGGNGGGHRRLPTRPRWLRTSSGA